MNVDTFIAQHVDMPSDLDCFRNFGLDMTQSMVLVDNNGKLAMVPAMARVSGQKESERQLYTITPRKATVEDKAAARQQRLDDMAAAYANDPSFEVECDTMTLATGLAKACHTHGVDPSFLLDDDGTL